MIRSFIALPLPEGVRDALTDLQDDLQVGRLVAHENFHITLAYLDKQTPQTLERVHEILEQMRIAPFEVALRGVDVFGGRAPRVVWSGVAPSEPLTHLRDKVRRAAMRGGVELARETFRPHVTLSRIKGRLGLRDHARIETFLSAHSGFQAGPFEAEEIVLYRSTLHQSGAIYDPMTRYPLAEG